MDESDEIVEVTNMSAAQISEELGHAPLSNPDTFEIHVNASTLVDMLLRHPDLIITFVTATGSWGMVTSDYSDMVSQIARHARAEHTYWLVKGNRARAAYYAAMVRILERFVGELQEHERHWPE